MKPPFQYALLLLMPLLFSCRKESADPIDPIVTECVGASFYYFNNQSSRILFVTFSGDRLNGQIDSTTAVPHQQVALIGQDASFGSIPKPTNTFSRLNLYTLVDGKRVLAYSQSPVQDALWARKKQNVSDPDFGCQQVDYTLTITDNLLK